MRSHSEGVRSAVLDSVLPTTVDQLSQRGTVEQLERVLGLLAETCAADPTCNSAYPNPLGDLDAVVAKYEADPFEGEITNPVTGRRVPITVTGQDIVGGAYQAFYDTTLIPLLPLFTRQLLAGETGIIPPLAERALQDGTAQAEGMAESVNCSDTARIRAEADSADIAALVAEHPTWEQFIGTEGSSCDRWDVEPAPDGFNDPVRSDIRTLVLAGEFDPTTPPGWSKAAAEKLSNATYVEFPGLGHVTLYAHDCPVAIFSSFLDEPNRAVDTTCVDQMPGVKFTTP
jgi:pimeloyl-ACP methyl ester carboxylesterase